jgi:hypothetical protein
MASLVVNQGLQMIGDRASGVAGAGAAIVTGAVDNATGTTLAAHTKLNDITSTSIFAAAFDATPTRSGQVVSHIWTVGTGSAAFAIGRFSLHNTASGSTTVSSTGLMAAVDGFTITQNGVFAIVVTFKLTYTSV